jgi:ribosomal protein S18 acetylase RimI-like enzyme
MLDIRPLRDDDREHARNLLTDSWGSTVVAIHGVTYDAAALPGFIANIDGSPAGLVTYHVEGDAWEVVTLDAVIRERGIGTALLQAVERAASEAGARRLWLITTNENVNALRFYQQHGFDLVAIHRDAVTRARERLKPSIPLDVDGIPLRHELELERILGDASP